MGNIIFDRSDCEKIRCGFLISHGVCKLKGNLAMNFQCKELEAAQDRHDKRLEG